MTPRRVRNAVFIAFLCHSLFILTARHRLSYDAFTHMLFAEHYAGNWFSLWEPRWYTGFTVVSYPPLTHQLIGLLVPLLGFEKAFALILWLVTTLYPLGVYAFSRIFTGRISASYAALVSSVLLPIYVTAHIFGQLPFLASTLLSLVGAASLNRYLREGGLHNFLLTVSLYTTTMALHHATLLVQPFFIFAVVVNYILGTGRSTPWRTVALRVLFICPFAVLSSLLVIWPFWQWGAHQIMQTPIDHLSRHNFFADPLAFAVFFFPMYGPLFFFIPFLLHKWHPRFIGLLISFSVLFLLGLGGTTPLPPLIFGDAWEWLTYDRFAFWASLTLTPFFGMLFIGLRRRFRFTSTLRPAALRRSLIPALTFSFFAVTALGAWLTPYFFPIQPDPVDMKPIVNFLNVADRSRYRYLTFGLGDQFAYLNLLTDATTIDGSYHTARTLPELRVSGIGQIDTVYWALKGIPAIEPILRKSGEHGVRWGFVNRKDFAPVLEKMGWVYLITLPNRIQVWENPQAVVPEASTAPEADPFTTFSWGVFPLLSLVTTLSLGALRIMPVQAEKALRGIHAILVGFIPLSFCFWYYRTIAEFPHARVYFTYTDALFFLTDALAVLAVVLWLSVILARSSNDTGQSTLLIFPFSSGTRSVRDFFFHPSSFSLFLFSLFLLASLSVLWSRDWRISLYISLHFWLVFLLILSLGDWNRSWNFVMLGLTTALSIQILMGLIGFTLQSTAFLKPFELKWPGLLDPFTPSAVVVRPSDSSPILRAYGTFPHPNILGGFILFSLLGPVSLFLTGKRLHHLALIVYGLGIALLALTFSRSAWLGLAFCLIMLIWKSKHLDRKKLGLLLFTTLFSCAIVLLPRLQLLSARTLNIAANSEKFSFVGRAWLNQEAIQIFREYPLTGIGIGSFIIELAQRAGYGYIIEPVHNIFLSSGAELGITGLVIITLLVISVVHRSMKAQHPNAIFASAILSGLGIISLFDHYLWTLAPGRLMLGLALGLWSGQVFKNNL
jgi:O-antigen ligase